LSEMGPITPRRKEDIGVSREDTETNVGRKYREGGTIHSTRPKYGRKKLRRGSSKGGQRSEGAVMKRGDKRQERGKEGQGCFCLLPCRGRGARQHREQGFRNCKWRKNLGNEGRNPHRSPRQGKQMIRKGFKKKKGGREENRRGVKIKRMGRGR